MIRDILRRDYRAHEVLVAPARDSSEPWRLLGGIVLIVVLFMVFGQFFSSMLLGILPDALRDDLIDNLDDGGSPGAVLFFLTQLGLLIPATAAVVAILHKRDPFTLLGPPGLAVQQCIAVLMIQGALALAIYALPPYGYGGGAPVPNLSKAVWAMLLQMSLMTLTLQCAAEEIVFRGYIQQQLAARFASPLIWMLLPALLFGLGHYMPQTAGSNAPMIALWAVVFACLMSDLTARAGTLGPAIAVHLANNFMAILIMAPADDMFGLALYRLPFGLGDEETVRTWLMIDLAFICVSWLAARLVLRR